MTSRDPSQCSDRFCSLSIESTRAFYSNTGGAYQRLQVIATNASSMEAPRMNKHSFTVTTLDV